MVGEEVADEQGQARKGGVAADFRTVFYLNLRVSPPVNQTLVQTKQVETVLEDQVMVEGWKVLAQLQHPMSFHSRMRRHFQLRRSRSVIALTLRQQPSCRPALQSPIPLPTAANTLPTGPSINTRAREKRGDLPDLIVHSDPEGVDEHSNPRCLLRRWYPRGGRLSKSRLD